MKALWFITLSLFLWVTTAQSQAESTIEQPAKETTEKTEELPAKEQPKEEKKPAEKEDQPGLITKGITALFGEHSGDKLFYLPKKDTPYTPKKYGYKFENVTFASKDKTQLHGWFIPSKLGSKEAKATIVFSHGTSGSIAYHFGFISWLVDEGYNVWLYDYRGYGQSKGVTGKRGIIEDTIAAFKYIKTRDDIPQDKIISFGHSLGGAKSIAALSEFAPEGLKGVVVMGAFSSYKDIASSMAGNIGRHLVSDTYNPKQLVKKLPKTPLLVIHGEKDQIVPFSHGQQIFDNANEPKQFIHPKRGDHNNILFQRNKEVAKQLSAWLKKTLE